ncbi:MAG: type III pantothenate kinase [Phycisphaerales bacterium]
MSLLLAISVGNTRTAVGHFHGDQLHAVERLPSDDVAGIVAAAQRQWEHCTHGAGESSKSDAEVVVASVNDPQAARIEAALASALQTDIWRIGRDLEVPIGRCLDEGATPGQDRLLAAAAAFDLLKQAVIVVDAGTAVTVDFIDGEGVFHGGAIAPGAQMQLDALHARTAALPKVEFARPSDEEAFGRNTVDAMQIGVFEGIRGMTQALVERYSSSYGAFPLVLATGGDAEALFEDSDLVARVVPDLVLRGILVAVRTAGTPE